MIINTKKINLLFLIYVHLASFMIISPMSITNNEINHQQILSASDEKFILYKSKLFDLNLESGEIFHEFGLNGENYGLFLKVIFLTNEIKLELLLEEDESKRIVIQKSTRINSSTDYHYLLVDNITYSNPFYLNLSNYQNNKFYPIINDEEPTPFTFSPDVISNYYAGEYKYNQIVTMRGNYNETECIFRYDLSSNILAYSNSFWINPIYRSIGINDSIATMRLSETNFIIDATKDFSLDNGFPFEIIPILIGMGIFGTIFLYFKKKKPSQHRSKYKHTRRKK